MTLPYLPPGVSVIEAVTPQVVPLITSTAELVVVGISAGHQTRTDQFIINKGTKEEIHKLPFIEQLPGSKLVKVVSVYSALNPAEPAGSEGKGFAKYNSETKKGDWEEFTEGEHEGSIKSVGTGELAKHEGYLINVTYEYVPADYYNPIRLFSFGEVQNRFGNALNEEGKINSVLSLGAQKAFENGARSIILQPLLHTSTGSIEYSSEGFIKNATQPTAKQNSERSTWETTLQALNSVESIDLLTPIIGQGQTEVTDSVVSEVFNAVLGYELQRAEEQQYIFGVFGEDSTGSEGKASTIRTHAGLLRAFANGRFASSNSLVNIGNLSIQLPTKAATVNVGGQYAAAAVAGALASRPASVALTRKGIIGFQSVNDLRIPSAKNEDAESGLLVIEEIKGGLIRCRHGITLDNAHGSARREISVVRAKFNMIESIRETLENQIIGQIIADANSPLIVRSAISGVLSALVQGGEIVSYEPPVCQITSLEPATISATFSYRPAFTLNNIDITFSLDLTSQTVSVIEASNA